MDAILGFESNDVGFEAELGRHSEALNATIHHHPVIAAGRLDSAWERPQRMSDYQSFRSFRANPLFREVYQHLDSHYQIAYNVTKLENAHLVLSWNLKSHDFTERDVQRLHLVGLQVAKIARQIDESRRLVSTWQALATQLTAITGLKPAGFSAVPPIGAFDGRILAKLIKGRSRAEIAAELNWRRDTLDRHLAVLREQMGLESMPQLLHALAELRPGSRGSGKGV